MELKAAAVTGVLMALGIAVRAAKNHRVRKLKERLEKEKTRRKANHEYIC